MTVDARHAELARDFASISAVSTAVAWIQSRRISRTLARSQCSSDSPNAPRLALAARVVVLALAGAMALRQTGLADDIVNLAFGLTLGAAAVAFALAFGLGGRDVASRTLEDWRVSDTKERPKK